MMAGSTVATTFGLVPDRRGEPLAQVVDLGVVERDGGGHLDRQDPILGGDSSA